MHGSLTARRIFSPNVPTLSSSRGSLCRFRCRVNATRSRLNAIMAEYLTNIAWLLVVFSLAEWTIRVAMTIVLLRRPLAIQTKLAWLGLVYIFPEFGLLLYLLIGNTRLGRLRAQRHRETAAIIHERYVAGHSIAGVDDSVPDDVESIVKQAEGVGGLPLTFGNLVELLGDTRQVIDRLVTDIDSAQSHVHLLFYTFRNDETGRQVADALERAAARGVDCRLLADAVGSTTIFRRNGLAAKLNAQGVHVRPALPVNLFRLGLKRIDLRNHRKVAVVDGRIGYTGSQNIVDSDYGYKRSGIWIDLMARFTGPVVRQIQIVFIQDWSYEVGELLSGDDLLPDLAPTGTIMAQIAPTGPTHDAATFRRIALAAIHSARHRIIITSPYIVPDEHTAIALSMAVQRGVDVTAVMPLVTDQFLAGAAAGAYVGLFVEQGIRVFRFRPGLLHSKTMTVDDRFALVGTANLDVRSLRLNFENTALMYGEEITKRLRDIQQDYMAFSSEVTLEEWRSRSIVSQYISHAAALVSPLL